MGQGSTARLSPACGGRALHSDRLDVHLVGDSWVRDFIRERIEAGTAARVDENGRTVLYIAAHVGDIDSIKRLLAAGLKADRPDNSGITALDIAVEAGNREAIAVLRESIADPGD